MLNFFLAQVLCATGFIYTSEFLQKDGLLEERGRWWGQSRTSFLAYVEQ